MALPPDPARNLAQTVERLTFRVGPADAAGRIDRFLAARLPWRSRTGVQRLLEEGRVLVAAAGAAETGVKRAATRLPEGATVVVITKHPRVPLPRLDARVGELSIVHEDEWLLAVDKPPGLAAHPAGRHLYDTLITVLHRRYRSDDPARDVVPRLCHRLDRETSGVVLVSKDEDVRHHLGRQFEDRKIEKEYLAIVEGAPDRDAGVIDRPIGRARDSRVKVKMAIDPRGQHAVTRYEVVERAGALSLVRCRPLTGRQHQIRVHLAAIGHPVVGDKIYGPDESLFLDSLAGSLDDEKRRLLRLGRHALHAHRLTFTHPKTGERLTVTAPLPEDLRTLLASALER
ncbi:MAG TPA: RluA family pseudouridine synthase [Planctomycetota bacterium]|nr:RluA family pseudouridine synthase [Planctomycetota bacterium]